jgi:hypothetical protein
VRVFRQLRGLAMEVYVYAGVSVAPDLCTELP